MRFRVKILFLLFGLAFVSLNISAKDKDIGKLIDVKKLIIMPDKISESDIVPDYQFDGKPFWFKKLEKGRYQIWVKVPEEIKREIYTVKIGIPAELNGKLIFKFHFEKVSKEIVNEVKMKIYSFELSSLKSFYFRLFLEEKTPVMIDVDPFIELSLQTK